MKKLKLIGTKSLQIENFKNKVHEKNRSSWFCQSISLLRNCQQAPFYFLYKSFSIKLSCFWSKILICRSWKQICDLCFKYLLPKNVGVGSQKSSNYLSFCETVPNISNDNKFSEHYTFRFDFSDDINNKLFFNKIISKFLMK